MMGGYGPIYVYDEPTLERSLVWLFESGDGMFQRGRLCAYTLAPVGANGIVKNPIFAIRRLRARSK